MKKFAIATGVLASVEGRNVGRMEAQPTLPVMFALNGFSPAPTTPPSPDHVAARADSNSSPVLFYNTGNTCGYLSGISSAPYYCDVPGNYCALSPSAHGNIGRIACCGASECNYRTTCVNSAEIYTAKACDVACRDNTYIVKCTESAHPYCNTVSLEGGIIDYACGNSDIRTYQVLQTSYSGQINPQSYTAYTVTGTSVSETSESSASATGAPLPTSSTAGTATASSSSTAEPTGEKKSSKSSTPVGAIVGGVVGGVGAIALIVIGILLFLRNKKKKQNAQQSPPAPLMSQPQTGGGPPSQPQYAYPNATNAAYPTSPSTTGAYYPPQQGSPGPNYPYSQPSVSPPTSYAPQPQGQQPYGQQPYQQAGSPPPMQHQYAPPVAAGGATGLDNKGPSGPVHEVPTEAHAGHRGEMQELE